MRSFTVPFLLIALIIANFSSCKEEQKVKKEYTAPLIEGLKNYDLTDNGIHITVPAPVNASIKQTGGITEIFLGETFALEVQNGNGDLQLYKKDIEQDPVRKFVKYHVDQENFILYECLTAGKPDFHFIYLANDGFDIVEFRNKKEMFFALDQIQKMAECAQKAQFN